MVIPKQKIKKTANNPPPIATYHAKWLSSIIAPPNNTDDSLLAPMGMQTDLQYKQQNIFCVPANILLYRYQ